MKFDHPRVGGEVNHRVHALERGIEAIAIADVAVHEFGPHAGDVLTLAEAFIVEDGNVMRRGTVEIGDEIGAHEAAAPGDQHAQ